MHLIDGCQAELNLSFGEKEYDISFTRIFSSFVFWEWVTRQTVSSITHKVDYVKSIDKWVYFLIEKIMSSNHH